MWTMYDELIDGIPTDWTADEIVLGHHYSCVRSRDSVGIGGAIDYDYRQPMFARNLEGLPLREVAQCIRSWNFGEAAIGQAAINAYYNNPAVARAAGVAISDGQLLEDRIYDPFIMSQNEIRGKKVTILGHVPHLETLFEPVCEMRIITADEPEDGDYPPTATDYLIPDSDYVFLGSSSFVDKSLPRLLKLASSAKKVTIVGPATPLAPQLFAYGVADLSGFVVKDPARVMRIIRGAENGKIFATGQKVAFKRPRT